MRKGRTEGGRERERERREEREGLSHLQSRKLMLRCHDIPFLCISLLILSRVRRTGED